MTGVVKIGKTTRTVEERACELFQTGVPDPFKIEYQVLSPDCHYLEAKIHNEISKFRVNPSREFFRIDVIESINILDRLLVSQIQSLVECFLPNHNVIESDLIVSLSNIYDLCQSLDMHPFEIISVINMLTPDEIRPAAIRYNQAVDGRRNSINLDSKLKVVREK